MSKKLRDIEKEIEKAYLKYAESKSNMAAELFEDEDFIDYGNGHRELVDTDESRSRYIEYLEKQRTFILERKGRKFYNQEWFKILLATIVGALITKLVN